MEYGIKWLKDGYSLTKRYDKIYYKLNEWIEVPGNGAYVSHTGGLFSGINDGNEFAVFECEREIKDIDEYHGVKCWRYVKRIDNNRLLKKLIDICAEATPHYALIFCANLLSKKRLDLCAEEEPFYAFQFCADLLSKERLDWCMNNL